MYNSVMKSIISIVAIAISFIGFIPYIKDSLIGKTKPHIMSWFTWSLISYIAFGIQVSNGGGVGSFPNLATGIICTIIFGIGLKNGTKYIKKIDLVAFTLAIIAIILWLFVDQPVLSIILVAIIDALSFLPTIRKSWNNPETETVSTFILNTTKNVLLLFALESLSFVNILYPVYSIITNVIFVGILLLRREIKG